MGRRKFSAPKGKFVERPIDRVGRERGEHVCGVCRGTCCAAVQYLIHALIDVGEVRSDIKVILEMNINRD